MVPSLAEADFVYFGLEPYEERYTMQMHSWLAKAAERSGVTFACVGEEPSSLGVVRTGVVLDGFARSCYSMQQISAFLTLVNKDQATCRSRGLTLFFEDMWTPGIEAIPYALSQAGIPFRMYARCHAQSVDPHDFTFPMRSWIRHHERGICASLSKLFVGSQCHIDMLVGADVISRDKCLAVGLPYSSHEVTHRSVEAESKCANSEFFTHNSRRVLFTSRWDDEKQPWFFIEVAKRVTAMDPTISFVATTSRAEESDGWRRMQRDCAGTPVTPVRCSKGEYYVLLSNSGVQFNCALQDFISYTLLEAVTLGCIPVYPRYLSFMEMFDLVEDGGQYLYTPWNIEEAAVLVMRTVNSVGRDRTSFIPIINYNDRAYTRIFEEMGL